MAIDYDKLLRDPKIRLALGKRRVSRALNDENYLPDLISEKGTPVLCLEWDTHCSGANWMTEWQGYYFFSSSDYDSEGPIESLEEALGDERFHIQTSNPALTSEVLPLETLLEIGNDLAGEERSDVWINCTRYVLTNGSLVEAEEKKS